MKKALKTLLQANAIAIGAFWVAGIILEKLEDHFDNKHK